MVALHTNAITQNRAAGIRARGINGNDAYRLLRLAVMARQMIHQRALPRPGSSRESDHARLPTKRKQGLQQLVGSGRTVFNQRNCTRQRPRIASAQ